MQSAKFVRQNANNVVNGVEASGGAPGEKPLFRTLQNFNNKTYLDVEKSLCPAWEGSFPLILPVPYNSVYVRIGISQASLDQACLTPRGGQLESFVIEGIGFSYRFTIELDNVSAFVYRVSAGLSVWNISLASMARCPLRGRS